MSTILINLFDRKQKLIFYVYPNYSFVLLPVCIELVKIHCNGDMIYSFIFSLIYSFGPKEFIK